MTMPFTSALGSLISSCCVSFLVVLVLLLLLPRAESAFLTVSPFISTSGKVQLSRILKNDLAPEHLNNLDLSTSLSNVWASTTIISDLTTDSVEQDFMLSPTATIIIFLIGLIPFTVATVEFWRRIAVGQSFGTGSDRVVFGTKNEDEDNNNIVTIGQDGAPISSRGQRILGRDALVTAYILFAVSAAVLGLVIFSVVTSPPLPPPVDPTI